VTIPVENYEIISINLLAAGLNKTQKLKTKKNSYGKSIRTTT
jgi:hypothetical protein